VEKLLIQFIDTLDQSLKKILREVGDSPGLTRLTIHQLQYIDAIYELNEPTITELARRLNITKASVTAGIDKLARLGYVVKTQSSLDKRVFHVRLSDAGVRLIDAKYQALKEYGAFIRSALGEVEAQQFEQTLTRLVRLFAQD
jgi:DNA-binding MarR family transcriptional regulator